MVIKVNINYIMENVIKNVKYEIMKNVKHVMKMVNMMNVYYVMKDIILILIIIKVFVEK